MRNPYKTRTGGAAVTVFMPYDCGSRCPFCADEGEYAGLTGFSEAAIQRSIRKMHEITPACDLVLAGGEPLANLAALQGMLDAFPAGHRIYINTALPVSQDRSAAEILEFTRRNRDKITCMNVSRNLRPCAAESGDDLLVRLGVPVCVDCVLYRDSPAQELPAYLERFEKIPGIRVQFRFDCASTTPENLYEEEEDPILCDLKKIARYTGLRGSRIRCEFCFDYQGMKLTYCRALPNSTVTERDPHTGAIYDILYTVLIKKNGEIHSDWNGTRLDLAAYRGAAHEPYGLRWLGRAD